ncbi:MAG TPA: carboxypeptidase-like regulatory domain-containing protein [Longimicrobiales bacterium]|nr:carboxypeptidase-like regulatory domain-containing protein [Longimicrobiales bacterium]
MMRARFLFAAALLLLAHPAAAQETSGAVSLPGRVIGPSGETMAGQVVVLHRVSNMAGATVATDTTDAEGRFVLESQDTAGAAAATYFVAARYQGELYIGAPFQPPLPDGVQYTVQVGVPGTSASALMGSASEPAARPTMPGSAEPFPYARWLFLVIPLLIVALVAGYMLTRHRTPATRRRLLAQVAELDETHDAELAAGHVEDSTLYWAERRALLEQLTRAS